MSISDADLTARLLSTGRSMTDLLATAAARMVTAWRRQRGQQTPAPLLALETHGRADVHVDKTADTSDTVGLLSAIYPLRIHCDGATTSRGYPAAASITACCGTCAPIPRSDYAPTANPSCC